MTTTLGPEVFTPTPRKTGALDHAMAALQEGGRQNGGQEPGQARLASAPASGVAQMHVASVGSGSDSGAGSGTGSGTGSGGTAVPLPASAAAGLSCTEQLAAAALRGEAQKAAFRGFHLVRAAVPCQW